MNYYQHHIGDFNNATRHLSRLERAIYRDLIDLYYETEMPLQCERIQLARKVLVRGDEEMAAMCAVLDEFFTLETDGHHHSRCDEELAKVYTKSATARVSAEKRWAKHAKKSGKNANAMRTHSEGNATQDPLPNTQNKKKTIADAIPDFLNSEAWGEWVAYLKQRKKTPTPATIAKQHKFLSQYDKPTQQRIIDTSIEKGWAGLFEPKEAGHATNRPTGNPGAHQPKLTPAQRVAAKRDALRSQQSDLGVVATDDGNLWPSVGLAAGGRTE